MVLKQHNRAYDLIILGATGYTGALTAKHVAATFPEDLKWALVGRTEEKLKQLAMDCRKINTSRNQPEIETCNVNDSELSILVRKAFVVISTLGPYSLYGEPTFRACAEAGTHYLDCTGEVPFTHDMIKKYHKTAEQSGARMFPQCGLESAPSDLLAWSLVRAVRSQCSSPTSSVVVDLHQLDSSPSGGTLSSLLGLFDVFSTDTINEALEPFALSPIPNDNLSSNSPSTPSSSPLLHVPGLGLLTTSLTGPMNAALVFRSWGLSKFKTNSEFYGPNFTYRELEKARNIVTGSIAHYGLLTAMSLVRFPLVRSALRKFVYKPGDGPDLEAAKKDVIEFRGIAEPDVKTKTQARVLGTFSYVGSMYYLTATLLAQGALTLLEDNDLHLNGGVLTPSCLGQSYIDRLEAHGVKLETKLIEI